MHPLHCVSWTTKYMLEGAAKPFSCLWDHQCMAQHAWLPQALLDPLRAGVTVYIVSSVRVNLSWLLTLPPANFNLAFSDIKPFLHAAWQTVCFVPLVRLPMAVQGVRGDHIEFGYLDDKPGSRAQPAWGFGGLVSTAAGQGVLNMEAWERSQSAVRCSLKSCPCE